MEQAIIGLDGLQDIRILGNELAFLDLLENFTRHHQRPMLPNLQSLTATLKTSQEASLFACAISSRLKEVKLSCDFSPHSADSAFCCKGLQRAVEEIRRLSPPITSLVLESTTPFAGAQTLSIIPLLKDLQNLRLEGYVGELDDMMDAISSATFLTELSVHVKTSQTTPTTDFTKKLPRNLSYIDCNLRFLGAFAASLPLATQLRILDVHITIQIPDAHQELNDAINIIGSSCTNLEELGLKCVFQQSHPGFGVTPPRKLSISPLLKLPKIGSLKLEDLTQTIGSLDAADLRALVTHWRSLWSLEWLTFDPRPALDLDELGILTHSTLLSLVDVPLDGRICVKRGTVQKFERPITIHTRQWIIERGSLWNTVDAMMELELREEGMSSSVIWVHDFEGSRGDEWAVIQNRLAGQMEE